MHGLTCLRRLIAACLIALAVVLLKVLFGENVFPSAIPPETIAIIREYIATVDRFIADGDVHALEWHLATLGTNLALWPQPADGAFEPIAALAFRATFPCLHIGLAGIHIARGVPCLRHRDDRQRWHAPHLVVRIGSSLSSGA